MIQELKLDEDGYRGARFDAWNREVRGNNDLLILTQPDAIRDIHLAYFRAGADIVSTNTFSSTSIAQADYGMAGDRLRAQLSRARGSRARPPTSAQKEDGRPRFVAGALGPTNRTASISPDVNNPGFRAVTFDELRMAYGEQARGLLDGGADLLLIETIFDTLNAKAAIYAIAEALRGARRRTLPVMISGTITDRSGRLLSGPDAGGVLELGAPRRAVLDRPELRARRQGDARAYRRAVARRRHAGLRLSERRPAERVRPLRREPGRHGGAARRVRRRRPRQHRRRLLRHHARRTSAPSPRRCKDKAPRAMPEIEPRLRLSGLEAVHAHAGDPVRQRRRAHQRHRLGEIPQAHHRRRLRRRARRSRASRSRTARRSSTSTWTRACSIPRRRW